LTNNKIFNMLRNVFSWYMEFKVYNDFLMEAWFGTVKGLENRWWNH